MEIEVLKTNFDAKKESKILFGLRFLTGLL